MNRKQIVSLVALIAVGGSPLIDAQTLVKEDFTGATTNAQWYHYNGACLTASNTATSGNPGTIPGCVKDPYYTENLVGGSAGTSANSQQLPDLSTGGALRFTNGSTCPGGSCSGGFSQNGVIVSKSPYTTTNGLNITFATVTYRGNSSGNGGNGNLTGTAGTPGVGLPISGNDGADGISFFLIPAADASGNILPPPSGAGSWGGSLGYSCSLTNPNFDGIPNGYLGLGIDEYGNFLNPGDNTNTGPGLQANRIGLRGAGNINWASLSSLHPEYYPASLTGFNVQLTEGPRNGSRYPANQAAVYEACYHGGQLYDWSGVTAANPTYSTIKATDQSTGANLVLPDYAAVPGGYTVLSGVKIGSEYADGTYARGSASTIYYRVKLTSDGLLSLQYSFNGGAYNSVLTDRDVTSLTGQGTMPSQFYFGFGGSTGGATNIHEILCFQVSPANQSASSTTTNQRQSAQLNESTQAFFAFYNPNDWTGRLTANGFAMVNGGLTVNVVPTWDASCVLTGETATQCSTQQATTVETPTARQILTWDGAKGVPFESAGLNSTLLNTVTLGDSANGIGSALRINYLRGDRTYEVGSNGVNFFRDRPNVLGDIIDSSPNFVGPPIGTFPSVWRDRAHPAVTLSENTGQTYVNFQTVEQNRVNVVYVGANDGMLHGFRAGSLDSTGHRTNAYANDGYEVMAYVPGSVLSSAGVPNSAGNSDNCTSMDATQSVVQNIHGVTPQIGSSAACLQVHLDYSNPDYGHNFFVDGPPGSGDLYYSGKWHTWLVGGLGAGGAAIYALDVTDPANGSTQMTEANASAVVMGEWTPSNLSCTGNSGCGASLGNGYGTPLIRRLHDGNWGIIFGNGLGSANGDAGIFIIIVPQGTAPGVPLANPTIYYLPTNPSVTGNGIASVAAADLDGDSITDYVYAGDLQGNLWRFDLTSTNEANWAVSSAFPLYSGGPSQPITSAPIVAAGPAVPGGQPLVMVAFGTGQKTELTNTKAVSYQSAPQRLNGVWDWNMTGWNTLNAAVTYAGLTAGTESGSNCVPNVTLAPANLTTQTYGVDAGTLTRTIATNATVNWPAVGGGCNHNTFGWTAVLPGGQEQIIANPIIVGSAFQVNSVVPAINTLQSCNPSVDTGFTYAVSLLTGGAITNFFQNFTNDSSGTVVGIGTNATGSSTVVNTSQSANSDAATSTWLVYQTTTGTPSTTQINPPNDITAQRVTWKQLR